MTDFIVDGHFERHIRRMREMYRRRRDVLVALLARSLGDLVKIDAPDSGMNLIVWLPTALNDARVAAALLAAGVDALPISAFALARRMRPGLLLGYSGVREPELRDGVIALKKVLTAQVAGARRR
jgi:GntR family transcriptional regulator/MocR family aminotransferase